MREKGQRFVIIPRLHQKDDGVNGVNDFNIVYLYRLKAPAPCTINIASKPETREKGHESRKSKKQFHSMCRAGAGGGRCFWLG